MYSQVGFEGEGGGRFSLRVCFEMLISSVYEDGQSLLAGVKVGAECSNRTCTMIQKLGWPLIIGLG